MILRIEIPDELVACWSQGEGDMARKVLEDLAVETFRCGRLSSFQVGQLLGHASRWETQAFLAFHDLLPELTIEEVVTDADTAAAFRMDSMIVISDTSPLSALAEIGELTLLPRLYDSVVVPETVRKECLHPHAPVDLSPWFSTSTWLQVVPDPIPLLPEVAALDPGEAAAITLAWSPGTKP